MRERESVCERERERERNNVINQSEAKGDEEYKRTLSKQPFSFFAHRCGRTDDDRQAEKTFEGSLHGRKRKR